MGLVAVDHDFRGARAGVVVRTHRHAVSTSRHDRQQIARLDGQWASVAEEVAGSTGLSSDLLKKMLPILAMAVVGYMMKQHSAPAGNAPASGGGGGGILGGALGGILGQVVTGMLRR